MREGALLKPSYGGVCSQKQTQRKFDLSLYPSSPRSPRLHEHGLSFIVIEEFLGRVEQHWSLTMAAFVWNGVQREPG